MDWKAYLARSYADADEENRRVIVRLAKRHAAPGARLLDIGCGDGRFAVEFAHALGAAELFGLDIIDERLNGAPDAGCSPIKADLRLGLPFQDEAFDVVHSNQVIEHLENTDQFVREIARVLRPNGLAVVSTNNLSSWHNILSLVVGFQPPPCHPSSQLVLGNPWNPAKGTRFPSPFLVHQRIFTPRALAELCALHGLQPCDRAGAGYYPFIAPLSTWLAVRDGGHAAFQTVCARKLRRRPSPAPNFPVDLRFIR